MAGTSPTHGQAVVLTADASLTAAFPLLFDGMLAASQTTSTPEPLLRLLLLPRHPGTGVPALTAPLGLRRVEAALLRDGFRRDEVVVSDERGLSQALGGATQVVGVATGDPLGRGMNSTTMAAVAGGRSWPTVLFQRLVARVRRLAPQARILVGGPGAWQLAQDAQARRGLGIHQVVNGYCEEGIAATVRQLAMGGTVAVAENALAPALAPGVERIPALRGAATFGAVELSRGCGWQCGFCTLGSVPMQHLSAQQVLADVAVNRAAGLHQVALLSEDAFRYGASGLRVAPAALLALVEEVRRQLGHGPIQLDHANVASVARWSDAELTTLHRLLSGDGRTPVWLNLGVESSDGHLLVDNGCTAKLGGHAPGLWGDLCATEAARLARCGFVPFLSLLMGLPGQTPEHTRADLLWVESLDDLPIAVFPMVLAPLESPWQAPRLTQDHWRLMQGAYRRNFRHIPWLYQRQSAQAGVSSTRRLLLRGLGMGQVAQWTGLFAWRRWWARP